MTESMTPTLVQRQPLSRGYRGLLGLFVFVLLVATIFSLLYVVIDQESFWEHFPTGLFVGFIAIISINAAALTGETAILEVGDRSAFVSQVNTATSEMGYSPATQTEDFFVYKPSSWFKTEAFAWPISLHLHDKQAVIVGPKMLIKRLLKRLAEA